MKTLTKHQLAGIIGISASHLSNILSGRRRPTFKTAKKMCSVIDFTGPVFWLEATPSELRWAVREYLFTNNNRG